jgi:hypothetical protein
MSLWNELAQLEQFRRSYEHVHGRPPSMDSLAAFIVRNNLSLELAAQISPPTAPVAETTGRSCFCPSAAARSPERPDL